MSEFEHAPLILAILGFFVLLSVLSATRRTGRKDSGAEKTIGQRIADYYLEREDSPPARHEGQTLQPGPRIPSPDLLAEGPPFQRGRPCPPYQEEAYPEHRRNSR